MSLTDEWLEKQDHGKWEETFNKRGYLVVNNLLSSDEVREYQAIYDKLLSNEIEATSHRHDLGSHTQRKDENNENICQIMWPSNFVDHLCQGKLHSRAHKIAQIILGADMEFDFDMLISKAPHTDTVTPMHQDESYWLDMPDKRAVTVWVALDNATVDNGCMWFVPGSHKNQIRKHRPAAQGHHVLCCDGHESEMVPAPILAGTCTLHHGRTIHYTRGNSTGWQRRAFIVNYRPGPMVQWERDHNFDHGKSKGVGDILKEDESGV